VSGNGVLERVRLAIDVLLSGPPEPPWEPQSRRPQPAFGEGGAAASRRRLAQAVIACLDALESDEDAAAVARGALSDTGISPIGADGEPFDRNRHRAQGRVPTDNPDLDWTVASCAVSGWADGEQVLRPADVWVYRLTTAADGAGR
jgi:hypothetical protein